MEVTISTSETTQGGSNTTSELSYFSRDYLDFVLTSALQSYIENEEYPIFVEKFQLTYQAPRWVSTERLALFLTGAIKGEMETKAQVAFSNAVVEFLADSNDSSSCSLESQMLITQQGLVDGYDPSKYVNPDYDERLEVHVTLYQEQTGNWVNASSYALSNTTTYTKAIVSAFRYESDMFVRQYLKISDSFFKNVHTAQAKLVEDVPTPAPSPYPTVADPSRLNAIKSFYKEPEGALKFRAVTASVVLLPILILVVGGIVVRQMNKRKGRQAANGAARQERAPEANT